VAASLAGLWVVPHLGWQYMFVIGALPALLALALRSLLPESPRWLAVHGRHAEADAAMTLIERETQKRTRIAVKIGAGLVVIAIGCIILAAGDAVISLWRLSSNQALLILLLAVPIALGGILTPFAARKRKAVRLTILSSDRRASWSDLFGPLYLRRTLVVWVIWFSAYFVNYGLSIWLPTVYRTMFKLPLDQSLRYGLITQAVGLIGTLICALAIDYVGRRLWFALAFAGAAAALGVLATYPAPTADQVLTCMSVAYFYISTINIGVYLYTPELYPTRVRAIAVGAATAWLRFASMIGPTVVGMMIASGLPAVFVTFAAVAGLAAVITGLFAVETRGRVLEEASP
jgi:putative MFS transporter